jgi:Na+/H+ antiporter NhaD/arsenite permease-like protein
MTWNVALSLVIFGVSLYFLLSEKLNRTIVAMAGAVAMIVIGLLINFYDEAEALRSIDFETIGLLLGMMILVALLETTGFIQYLAVWAGKLSRGSPVRLLILLGTVTTVLSMFLDNVTTVVLVAPVTILICEILGINPAPLLTAEALLSNTGGTATLVGDPPNVLIASAANFNFNDFLIHSLPIIFVTWLAALLLLIFLFRTELATKPRYADAILQLNPAQALENVRNARRVLFVLAATLLLFFFQGTLHVSPAFIALGASAAALVWIRPSINDILRKIEWNVLVFFAGLFVMVGGLEASGALQLLSGLLSNLSGLPPVWLGVSMIWVIAGLSAIVDNVPITIAMIPVIESLGASGIDIQPLWWALVFGAGLGGNATIIGSTANIVVVSLSEKTHTPITSTLWNRRGLPLMLLTCGIASLLYVLFFSWFKM